MKKQDILENQVNLVYLALGSNLGDKKNNLNNSIDLIQKEGILIKFANSSDSFDSKGVGLRLIISSKFTKSVFSFEFKSYILLNFAFKYLLNATIPSSLK